MTTNMKIGIGLLIVGVIGLFIWSRMPENGQENRLDASPSSTSASVDDIIDSIIDDSEAEAAAVIAETDEDGALMTNDDDELNSVNKTYEERGF